jgi:hypothetical protein
MNLKAVKTMQDKNIAFKYQIIMYNGLTVKLAVHFYFCYIYT